MKLRIVAVLLFFVFFGGCFRLYLNEGVPVFGHARACRDEAPHDHVLFEPAQRVNTTMRRRLRKHARCVLERGGTDERFRFQRSLRDAEQHGLGLGGALALGHLGDNATALPVLTAALQHDAPVVRLAALNVLDRFGSQARPALPAIRAAGLNIKDPIADYVNRMAEYVPARIESRK